MSAKQYRKKPVIIEAMELNQHNPPPIAAAWCGGRVAIPTGEQYTGGPLVIEIDTLEGVMTARQGDFIIKGVNGEFYPCKPDIFAKTYEPA